MTFRQDLAAVCTREWQRWGSQTLLADVLAPGEVDIQRRTRRGRGLLQASGSPKPIGGSTRVDEDDFDAAEIGTIAASMGRTRRPRRQTRRAIRHYRQGIVTNITVATANTGYEWATAYWRQGVSNLDPQPTIGGAGDVTDKAWSAAFISYAFRTAGAGNQFPYSQRHSEYIYHAMNNRLRLIDFANEERPDGTAAISDLTNVDEATVTRFATEFENRPRTAQEEREYQGRRGRGRPRREIAITRDPASLAFHLIAYKLDEGYSPQTGDLICYTRSGLPNWNRPRRQYISHTDVVVGTSNTRVAAIGGNVADAVVKKYVAVSRGVITDRHWRWFGIVRNLIV